MPTDPKTEAAKAGRAAIAAVALSALIATSSQAAPSKPSPRYCAANQVAAEAGARAKANRGDNGSSIIVTAGTSGGCLAVYWMFGGADFGAAGLACSILGGLAGLASASSASAAAAETSRAEYLRLRDPRCEPTGRHRAK
jgi:hypothetical protein